MLAPGTSLGPYEVVALIGAGGMGEVYKARDPRLDRTVAIKVASEGFTERFEREARAVTAFNHRSLSRVLERPSGRGNPPQAFTDHRVGDRAVAGPTGLPNCSFTGEAGCIVCVGFR